jgi:hypothetical protein
MTKESPNVRRTSPNDKPRRRRSPGRSHTSPRVRSRSGRCGSGRRRSRDRCCRCPLRRSRTCHCGNARRGHSLGRCYRSRRPRHIARCDRSPYRSPIAAARAVGGVGALARTAAAAPAVAVRSAGTILSGGALARTAAGARAAVGVSGALAGGRRRTPGQHQSAQGEASKSGPEGPEAGHHLPMVTHPQPRGHGVSFRERTSLDSAPA